MVDAGGMEGDVVRSQLGGRLGEARAAQLLDEEGGAGEIQVVFTRTFSGCCFRLVTRGDKGLCCSKCGEAVSPDRAVNCGRRPEKSEDDDADEAGRRDM